MHEHHPFPDEFTAPGSSIYYALRFAPGTQRPELALVNAFTCSILKIPRQCSDPGVAVTKLRWWQDELERARKGQTQHPVIHRMAGLCHRQPALVDHITELFQVVQQEIGGSVVENRKQLEIHCRMRGSPFTRLLTVTAGGGADQLRWAGQLGQFVYLTEIIRDLGRELRRSHCLLPLDALGERGLSPATLLADEQQTPLAELLAEIATTHRSQYRKTLAGLPSRPYPALGPALSLAAMADALLQEIAREGYRVLHQRIDLTPLTKLWIAWRCQRKARRTR